MAARKLSAAELSDFEEVPVAPRKLSAAELSDFEEIPDDAQLASAAGRPPDVPATPAKPKAKSEEPGFVSRALTSIGEGIGHVGSAVARCAAVTTPPSSTSSSWCS